MCGRFVGFRNVEALTAYFPIDRSEVEAAARYNIAPTQEILAIVRRGRENVLDRLHWGLVPFWAKDVSMGSKLINARAETVAEKPGFRNAFKKRRCLIPADGFYEWQATKGKKQPYFLTLPDEKPFAFAGLWESWDDRGKNDQRYLSCTIITKPASPSVLPVHHRMPAILHPDKYDYWLDPENQDIAVLKEILAGGTIGELLHRPVSTRVNNAAHDAASNINALSQMDIDFGGDRGSG